ncbi:unnamed protein product, partial [marine sediment metagenome]
MWRRALLFQLNPYVIIAKPVAAEPIIAIAAIRGEA